MVSNFKAISNYIIPRFETYIAYLEISIDPSPFLYVLQA